MQGNPDAYLVNLYAPGGQKLAAYQINTFNTGVSAMHLIIVSTLETSDQYFGRRRLAVLDQLDPAQPILGIHRSVSALGSLCHARCAMADSNHR